MFLPASIDLSQSEKYVLCVRLQSGRLSFAIRNPDKDGAFVYRETVVEKGLSYLEQVQRTVFDLNFLTQTFRQTIVQVVGARYALVPDEYFEAKNKSAYLEKSTMQETGHVFVQNIGIGQQLVASLETELFEFLSRNLFSPLFVHHAAALLQHFQADRPKAELFARMHLHFSGNLFDVAVVRGGRLVTMQSFTTDESDADLFYHAMNIWKAAGMNQLNDRLFLHGEAKKYGTLLPLFAKYVRHVERKGIPSESFLLLGEEADQVPIDLLALML